MKFDLDKDGPLIVRSTIIGATVVGLATIARSIRLFSKFQHARQIPEEFFRKQITIRGTVAFVTEDGLLRVQHKPTMGVPFQKYFSKPESVDGKLTVRIAGINLTSDCEDWLKKQILLKPVWLTLVKRNGADIVQCDVYLKKGRFFKYSLNRQLVRLGLGRVPGLDDKNHLTAFQCNAAYSRLVHDLILCEQFAEKRGIGVWKPTQSRFRGVAYAHEQFLWRTVLVQNNDVDSAMRVLNQNLSKEGLMGIMRRSKYYEYPNEQRDRISREYCKAIYDEDMRRKIKFVMRKNRLEPLPGIF